MTYVTGDGAHGLKAIEIDTAVCQGAKAPLIISNNAAWNIECYHQEISDGRPHGGSDPIEGGLPE